jgi:CBS domain containing-hemolysin-like protein
MRLREDIVALDVDSNTKEILQKIKKAKYSRMPVYIDTIDNIIGVLNIKDLKGVDTSKRDNHRRISAKARHDMLLDNKRLNKHAKDYIKHKPYTCDLGGK